jgi:hypothetical protein
VARVAYAVSGSDWLHWLALHLLSLGRISQLVLGASQFFVCAFLATDPPPRRLVAAQLATWNAGTLFVAVGVPTDTPGFVEAGGTLLAAGLVLFALALRAMKRRSLQRAQSSVRGLPRARRADRRADGARRVLGAWEPCRTALGAQPRRVARHRDHRHATHVLPLPHPDAAAPSPSAATTSVLWLFGVIELAIGAAAASMGVLAAGWMDLLAAAALLCVNLVASLRAAAHPLPLPGRLFAVAQVFLATGLAVALIATIDAGVTGPFAAAWSAALAVLLLAGWIGLTVPARCCIYSRSLRASRASPSQCRSHAPGANTVGSIAGASPPPP